MKKIDKVVQLVPAFHYGDAIGESMRNVSGWLMKQGIQSEIYSLHVDDELRTEAFLYPQSIPQTSGNSVIILHYALPSALSGLYSNLPGKKILLYHNITPAEYFVQWNAELAFLTHAGREELSRLHEKTDLALADSEYNRKELEEYGYKRSMVCPIWIPFRLYHNRYNDILASSLAKKVRFLFVGRVVPNKKIEDTIKIVYWYKENINPSTSLVIVGKYTSVPRYYHWLREYGKALHFSDDELYFTGHISYDDLVTYYKNSHMFISMSEHEGFCVPLVESMYFNIPVVAYASAAVPEILKDAGVLVHTKKFEYIAELMHIIMTDNNLRDTVIKKQKERLRYFLDEKIMEIWHNILSGL
ncbi:MAG: hypothetical protein A2Y62_17835 [Candidatus Fischerbacteria bacterium RBG_13_37_8]|uniref:Glycosyl transferase family 1 domain-containing protein n=1 Tax=Candidatus Fischerbacteria bacterium RBG_13_37_8 TaxID=1817863 RepID=A0A1F5VPG4_9BACT|nr:MAG: hypothetical protein A2Y62_17835 [Candidatus Fischerbacteria bacterium RBG_13_37_8]